MSLDLPLLDVFFFKTAIISHFKEGVYLHKCACPSVYVHLRVCVCMCEHLCVCRNCPAPGEPSSCQAQGEPERVDLGAHARAHTQAHVICEHVLI